MTLDTTIHIYSGDTDGRGFDLALCGESAEDCPDDYGDIWIGADEYTTGNNAVCAMCAEYRTSTHIISSEYGDERRMYCGARDGDDYTSPLTYATRRAEDMDTSVDCTRCVVMAATGLTSARRSV